MTTLIEAIMLKAASLPKGSVLQPRGFRHLGSRSAIQRAFSKLVQLDKLMRVQHGFYVMLKPTRFGAVQPPAEFVAKAIAAPRGDLIVPCGASAANVLGLTSQNSLSEVYLTSGRTRSLMFGKYKVLIRHAPRWMLALGESLAGAAVRALSWMGPVFVRKSLKQLRKSLPGADWNVLTSNTAGLPSWMSQAIREEAARA